MLDKWIADTKLWLAKPYREDGTALEWFFFLGLVAIIGFAWTLVLKRIID
jgi:hypothetical protein